MKNIVAFKNLKSEGKIYTVKAEVELKTFAGSFIDYETLSPLTEVDIFTVSFNIYNNGRLECCGQCLDRIKTLIKENDNKEWQTLIELHDKYHLNDLQAGTKRQQDCLKENNAENLSYEEKKVVLDKAGLLEDRGYKYGTGWLHKIIPDEDLKKIKNIIQNRKSEEEDDIQLHYEDILSFIKTLDSDRKLELWNDWQSEQDYDNYIHYNDEDFFETFFSNKMMEAIRVVCFGHYNYTDNYVVFNAYGNLDSFDYLIDAYSPYNDEAMAEIIDEHQEYDELLEEVKEMSM